MGLEKLLGHDPVVRVELALSNRSVQYAVSFGRGQDIGFQKAIDNSPRKRHHVRFWGLDLARAEQTSRLANFWLNTDRPPDQARAIWVGAGTRDTGLSLTKLSFQITHATDVDANAEQSFIVKRTDEKSTHHLVTAVRSGQHLPGERVNRYVTDGEITVARLK